MDKTIVELREKVIADLRNKYQELPSSPEFTFDFEMVNNYISYTTGEIVKDLNRVSGINYEDQISSKSTSDFDASILAELLETSLHKCVLRS